MATHEIAHRKFENSISAVCLLIGCTFVRSMIHLLFAWLTNSHCPDFTVAIVFISTKLNICISPNFPKHSNLVSIFVELQTNTSADDLLLNNHQHGTFHSSIRFIKFSEKPHRTNDLFQLFCFANFTAKIKIGFSFFYNVNKVQMFVDHQWLSAMTSQLAC